MKVDPHIRKSSWAIGDVHGQLVALDALLSAIPNQDMLYFLGDLVDRGEYVSGVIDRLISLKNDNRCDCILGNHEEMMLAATEDELSFEGWLYCGGKETMRSYGLVPVFQNINKIPYAHWQFLSDCKPYIVADEFLLSHAPLDPDTAIKHQSDEYLRWSKMIPKRPHNSGKINVFGHVAQARGEIYAEHGCIGIDTYAYGGGQLTALNLSDLTFIQSDKEGNLINGTLNFL